MMNHNNIQHFWNTGGTIQAVQNEVGLMDYLSSQLPNWASNWGENAISGGISGLGGSLTSSSLSGWMAPYSISSSGLATPGRSTINIPSGTPIIEVGNLVVTGVEDWRPQFDLNKAIIALNNNAQPKPTGYCARYIRTALEAGGLNTSGRPGVAADYNGYLPKLGFNGISPINHTTQRGDIVVFSRLKGHPYGHIQMYNGNQWVSDFKQRDFWPGSAYRTYKPSYRIFRW